MNFAALCRTFGVSRVTGYKWLARYRDGNHSVDALKDHSRRPLGNVKIDVARPLFEGESM